MPMNPTELQLKEASQLTGANWAVWLKRKSASWDVLGSYKLTKTCHGALNRYLTRPEVANWVAGALTAKRSRSRTLPQDVELACRKLYLYPEATTQRILLVGAEVLTEKHQHFWRVVSLGYPEPLPTAATGPARVDLVDLGELPGALDRVLRGILAAIPCQGGWLAIRSGDFLEIRVQSGCADCLGQQISMEANPLIRKLSQGRSGMAVATDSPDWKMIPPAGVKATTRVWAAFPLTIGRRMIGMLTFWRDRPFTEAEWAQLGRLTSRVAPIVEANVTFSSLTDHLRRLALLNDFALTVSSALDLDQIAQRIFALLGRAFNTEWVSLVLLSTDGNTLYHYFDQDNSVVLHTLPAEEMSVLHLVDKGEVFRIDELGSEDTYQVLYPGALSAILVPLKYRRQVIGAIRLESPRPSGFTVYDEHLLVVIASYLAGLVENGRLRQEAEARARNLSLIHDVVQQVMGLTDVKSIAQIAAELMARNFAYDLTVVALADEKDNLRVNGIGGSAAELVQRGLEEITPESQGGITNRVFVTGQSMLVNDVSQDSFYLSIPDWDCGSEMCVALREGERILGVIDVESRHKNAFTHNDLLVLEALAGILVNVIANAGQYQKLQSMVHQLQAAREELQERITAQRTAEARLIQAAKLAAVGEMAAGIAHELNNPLTTVSGFVELILEDLPKNASTRADLELIQREAHRARSVVRRLLDFARQGESVRVRADLNEIVEDVIALMSHLLHTSGVEVDVGLGKDLPWISVDRNQMKQVLLNLLHNALNAMPSGGNLTVKTASRKRDGRVWLTLSIRDSGVGISGEHMARIFEPFFTTRSDKGGTGLGLSVSYGIVTDHGGYIDVESKENEGTVFTVWLPVETQE